MSESNELEALKNRIAELESKLGDKSNEADAVSIDETKPIKNLYSWQAPDRVYPQRNKNWYVGVSIIALVSIFISLVMQNFALMIAILAIIFLIYVLYSVPPQIITNSITNKGVKSGEQFYLWKDVDYFWVAEQSGEMLINLELKDLQGRIHLVMGSGDINKIITELIQHEDYREPKGFSGFIDRITSGKDKKISEFIEIAGLNSSKKQSK